MTAPAPAPAPVLVTGGNGNLGGLVVTRLRSAGRAVRVLGRHPAEPADGVEQVRGDLSTGDGVAAALTGVETVVHCAGGATGDGEKARVLVAAARRAGVQHLVFISVVGADLVPQRGRIDRAAFGYYGEKRAAELAVEQSGIPFSTLRATQFHDLVLAMATAMAKLPVVPVPAGIMAQPVDAAEVADRLTELALGEPAGLVTPIGGPQVMGLDEAIRAYLAASGRRRPLLRVGMPGAAARVMRSGANLARDHADGRRTWSQFLSVHAPRSR